MIKNTIPALWTGMYVELPLAAAIRLMAGHGWRSFEVSSEHFCQLEALADAQREIAAIREACGECRASLLQGHGLLEAKVTHPDPQQRLQDILRLQRHIEIAQALGIKVMVAHPGNSGGATSRAERRNMMDLNVEAFRRLGDHAGARGLRLGLENLCHRLFASSAELLELLERINHPALGVTLDTSHANLTPGIDVVAAIRDFGPLLIATHLSDNDGSGDQHRTPGYGKIDWPAVIAALHEIDYGGVINLEIPGERHPDPDLKALKSRQALDMIRHLLARIGSGRIEVMG